MTAGLHDIVIEMGADWFMSVGVVENGISTALSGWQASLQARAPRSGAALFGLTTQGGGIVVDPVTNRFQAALPAAATRSIMVPTFARSVTFKGREVLECGVYDMVLVSPTGGVLRLLQGRVLLSAEVR